MLDILSNQVLGVAQNAIFNSVFQFTGGIQSPELRAAISRVAEELTVFAMGNTQQTILSSLPYYQRDLIGIYNPFDTITSENHQTSINNNLIGIYGKQISLQVENKAVMLVRDHLRSFFPHSEFINFDALTDTIIQLFSPSISQIVNLSINQIGSNLFLRDSISLISNGINNLTSIYGAIENIRNIQSPWEYLFVGGIVSSAITDAQKFILGSQGDNRKLEVLQRGFTDPSATYPLPEYAGRSEINKLAQGDVSNTIVIEKDKTRMTGAVLPGGGSWEQPPSSFKGEYPYNKVNQTESGHIIEVDDTPGAERLHIYHKSGTFIEIDSNGSITKRAVGSSYEIIDKNGKIAIAGKADVSINGACNIFVGNDANLEVGGDVNLTCFNDITAQAGGVINLSAKEEINLASGNINMTSFFNTNILAENGIQVSGLKSFNLQSDSKMSISSQDEMNIKTSKGIAINSQEDARLSSSKNVVLHPEGGIMLNPGGVVQVTTMIGNGAGASMKLYVPSNTNAPGVVNPSYTKAEDAIKAIKTKLGILSGRKDTIPIDVKDPIPLSYPDSYSILVDEEGQDHKEHRQFLISKGLTTTDIFDRVPVKSESKTDISTLRTKIVPDNAIEKNQVLPGNYRLTPNFTVDDLSEKAAIIKNKVKDGDLTYGQIIHNLQCLALNVLEPIYALYPNLSILSAYRDQNNSINTSQHPKGQAVDIQFKGTSYDDLYDIAVKISQAISFDQFILEYTSYSRTPWIHISFTKEKNRGVVQTFWNNRKYADGLHRLA